MGWDGYAYRKDDTLVYEKTLSFEEKVWFQKASDFVVRKTGTVDGFLKFASLDCHTCASCMEMILGDDYSMCSDELVTSEFIAAKLEELPAVANKDWAYWSALLFLRGCVKFGFNFRNNY